MILYDCYAQWMFLIILIPSALNPLCHIKTAEQRTIIQQYGDWYAGRWWVGCYIWYSEERPGRAAARPVPASLYQM